MHWSRSRRAWASSAANSRYAGVIANASMVSSDSLSKPLPSYTEALSPNAESSADSVSRGSESVALAASACAGDPCRRRRSSASRR